MSKKGVAIGVSIVIILLGLFAYGIYTLVTAPPPPSQAVITNAPTGITYSGPPTRVLAAYYCIKDMVINNVGFGQCTYAPGTGYACAYTPNPAAYHAPNYSIQMEATLDNSYLVQVIYNGSLYLITWGNDSRPITSVAQVQLPTCGWLVLRINHGVLYLGFARADGSPKWVLAQPVGDVVIEPGPNTGVFISSVGNGIGVDFGELNAILSLWYWNETLDKWLPASVSPGSGLATGFVLSSCVTYEYNTGVVTQPVYAISGSGTITQCPPIESVPKAPAPGFKP